jgi:hypothetical protein
VLAFFTWVWPVGHWRLKGRIFTATCATLTPFGITLGLDRCDEVLAGLALVREEGTKLGWPKADAPTEQAIRRHRRRHRHGAADQGREDGPVRSAAGSRRSGFGVMGQLRSSRPFLRKGN